MSYKYAVLVLFLAVSLGAFGNDAGQEIATSAAPLTVESAAIAQGATIPQRYTCDGDDISPPLSWGEMPASTQSLALIVDDPDAPGGTWDHWILFDIPPGIQSLAEGIPAEATVAGIGTHGENSWKNHGYGGPCPPGSAEHHYQFRLYALDTILDLQPGATKEEVIDAMDGHVLAQGEIIALYSR